MKQQSMEILKFVQIKMVKNKSFWHFSCFYSLLFFIGNKLTMESEIPERRRDSSIKKILSNQPLEKQEYVGKKFNKNFNIIHILFL